MSRSLLPPNTTTQERALEAAISRLDLSEGGDAFYDGKYSFDGELFFDGIGKGFEFGEPLPIAHLWNPDKCPLAFLPWLAWALSVDTWDAAWPEAEKRAVIKASANNHRKKGTPWAIRTALEAAGFKDVIISENVSGFKHNGTGQHNSHFFYNGHGHWAFFRIDVAASGEVAPEFFSKLINIVNTHKPVRSRLYSATAGAVTKYYLV